MKLTSSPLTLHQMELIIKRKYDWILSGAAPNKIILIGSAATYSMKEDSDIDIILIFNNAIDVKNAKEKLFLSRPKDDWPHDLFFFTKEEYKKSVQKGGGLCWLAEREGKILYERNENGS